MKMLLFVSILGLFMTIQSQASNTCEPAGPSIDCMNYVYADAGYSKAKAAAACKGATIECMNYVYADAGYNKVKAAELCSRP